MFLRGEKSPLNTINRIHASCLSWYSWDKLFIANKNKYTQASFDPRLYSTGCVGSMNLAARPILLYKDKRAQFQVQGQNKNCETPRLICLFVLCLWNLSTRAFLSALVEGSPSIFYLLQIINLGTNKQKKPLIYLR